MLVQKIAFALKSYIKPINTSTSSAQNNLMQDKATVPDKKKKKDESAKEKEQNFSTPTEETENTPNQDQSAALEAPLIEEASRKR